MKVSTNVQFLMKKAPNRDKGKDKFHYLGLVTDKLIGNKIAEDGDVLDFWSADDLAVEGDRMYNVILDVNSGSDGMFVKFVNLVGPAENLPF